MLVGTGKEHKDLLKVISHHPNVHQTEKTNHAKQQQQLAKPATTTIYVQANSKPAGEVEVMQLSN
jgi:hypothetical protein